MSTSPKIKSIFQNASRTAAEQDPDVRARILGSLALKAAQDPAFRDALHKNPTEVAAKEAAISNLQVSPEELREMGQTAKELTSRAIPDVDRLQVSNMVFGTIRDIEASFRLTLSLSKWLFFAGLAMVVASFLIVLILHDKQTAAIFGVGGLLNLIVGTVMNALDRVRNAAVNLVQVQMAYLAYYKILHMLGPAEGITSREDLIAYAEHLTSSVDKIMASLQGTIRSTKEAETKRLDRNSGRDTEHKGSEPKTPDDHKTSGEHKSTDKKASNGGKDKPAQNGKGKPGKKNDPAAPDQPVVQ